MYVHISTLNTCELINYGSNLALDIGPVTPYLTSVRLYTYFTHWLSMTYQAFSKSNKTYIQCLLVAVYMEKVIMLCAQLKVVKPVQHN